MSPLYLILYNVVSFLGWGYILYLTVQSLSAGLKPSEFYDVVSTPLIFVQGMAALEVLHVVLRFVSSPLFSTFLQVLSRLGLVFITTHSVASQAHWSLYLMVGSWSLVEVPRYLFFALKEANKGGQVAYPVFWLRYSLFAVLYPTGISGELLQAWNYMPALKSSSLLGFYFLLFLMVLYIPGGPFMYNHMRGQRKRAFAARNASAPASAPALSGIEFPVTDAATGERSTTIICKNALAAAIRGANPEKAKKIEGEKNWRFKYQTYFLDHVKDCAAAAPDGCVRMAQDGLEHLHSTFEFIRDGKTYKLKEAMNTFKGTFHTGVVKGTKPKPSTFNYTIPYKGKDLKGEKEILEQLSKWAKYGTIEPGAEAAIAEVVKNKEWLDLSDKYFVLLGAGSAMGPLLVLLSLGANVIAVDLNRPMIWKRLIGLARDSCGSMIFPVAKPQDECTGDDDLFANAGCNLFTQTPEISNWLRTVEPEKDLVVGGYAYLDGALHVKVALAMDAVMAGICEKRKNTQLAFLCTPTDAHMISEDAHKAAKSNLANMPVWLKVFFLIGRRLSLRSNVIAPIKSAAGCTVHIVDGLVVAQGPNYALAKRMQHWRAIVARANGHAVSTNIAPSTATQSVVSNASFAAAYGGMHHFKPMEVFYQETSNAVMGAILIHDVRNPKAVAKPSTLLPHPLALFGGASFHGGVWRCGVTIDSMGNAAFLLYYANKFKAYLAGAALAVAGIFAYPPHLWPIF